MHAPVSLLTIVSQSDNRKDNSK